VDQKKEGDRISLHASMRRAKSPRHLSAQTSASAACGDAP
jgi:hypothetical protein